MTKIPKAYANSATL